MEHERNRRGAIETISSNYSELSENCKIEVEKRSSLCTSEKFQTLFRRGQRADKVCFIVEGCARAFYWQEDKEITDWFAFENDFITPINSFFSNTPSALSIELMEVSTLLEISKKDILKLSNEHHDFERLCRVAVTRTMLHLQQRIILLQFQTAKQKYDNILELRPDVTQRIPLKHIASYLGITLETLSRIRGIR